MLRTCPVDRTPAVRIASRIVRMTFLGAAACAAAGLAGCGPSYEQQRPPVDQLDPRDAGLQSKDVGQASDKLAADLLALPELNDSRTQWTIVFDRVDDKTNSRFFSGNFDIFLQRLKTNVARQGKGRVTVVANRDAFHDVQNRELEGGGRPDEFGQGERGGPSGPSGNVQPDFALVGTAMDLPNRGTVYYNLQFRLVNLHNRVEVWQNMYEVRTSR